MCECYSKVRDWREVVNWDTRVEAMKKQHAEMESAFRLHCSIEQIKCVHVLVPYTEYMCARLSPIH